MPSTCCAPRERPVVIAGSGVWWAHAEERAAAVSSNALRCPLYTITMARGAVSDDHPLVMGYADPALNYAVHSAFREADLFLVIGKRIDYRLAMGGARLFPARRPLHPDRYSPRRAGPESTGWMSLSAPTRAPL